MIGELLALRRGRRNEAGSQAQAPSARGATIERIALAGTLDRLLAEHAGTERSVGVLVARVAAAATAECEFDPARDDVIMNAALARSQSALRPGDCVTAIGADELCFLLPMLSGFAQAELAALKLLRVLAEPVVWGASDAAVTTEIRTTIGVACSPLHGMQSGELVRAARAAARVAETKEDRYHVADAGGNAGQEPSHQLEAALRIALQNNALTLNYQPQIEIATGFPMGAEALARWTGADGRPVSPGTFIPLAEHRGLMRPLTAWCLNTALRELSMQRVLAPDLAISVNVSPLNLDEPDFPELVAQSLAMWSIPADRLTVEITESTPMQEAKALPMFQRLKAVGVRIAIDDFGTGYSSLALLRQLPVDELKIDQQFVRDMLRDESSMQIVRTVLDLAQNFGMKTVAEGVEDEATLNALGELGCTLAQGYFIARPLPADTMREWFSARQRSVSK